MAHTTSNSAVFGGSNNRPLGAHTISTDNAVIVSNNLCVCNACAHIGRNICRLDGGAGVRVGSKGLAKATAIACAGDLNVSVAVAIAVSAAAGRSSPLHRVYHS